MRSPRESSRPMHMQFIFEIAAVRSFHQGLLEQRLSPEYRKSSHQPSSIRARVNPPQLIFLAEQSDKLLGGSVAHVAWGGLGPWGVHERVPRTLPNRVSDKAGRRAFFKVAFCPPTSRPRKPTSSPGSILKLTSLTATPSLPFADGKAL